MAAAKADKSAGQGEVSNCVANLIHAFTDGLNVFKRLRERRRKRKSKHKERDGAASGAELQLSNSLRKGPMELKERYESCYSDRGEKFAKGDEPEKRKRSSSRQRSHGPTATRVSVRGSTQTQLAMVRPRNTRKGSTSSSSSTSWSKTASSGVDSPYITPPRSPPLPQYSAKDPFPLQKAPADKNNNLPIKKTAGTVDATRPTTWPQRKAVKKVPFANTMPTPQEYFAMKELPPHLPPPFANMPTALTTGIPRRRTDKPTPSTYTFASDSTKLGEIPQRNWTVPWNYDEAERMNAEAAVKGYPVATPVEQKAKTRKGLRSLFKKGGAGAAGSSAAYHLVQHAQDAGIPVEIEVYERDAHIGGRSTTIHPWSDPEQAVELGASIFVEVNHILVNASKKFNLQTSSKERLDGNAPEVGIWNGKELVFTMNEGGWWDLAKLFWRYGYAPVKANGLMRETVGRFMKMYEKPIFPWKSLSEVIQLVGLTEVTGLTGEQYLRNNGVADKFANEIVQAR
ncbi:hypothetical protein N0V90_010058 [Kalmusia sp. IMI 367209]|nr:hypothetical protein N0V90_010058 [Kalmusia sp. IMI 367209]